MLSGMVTLPTLWGYTYLYICIIYTHNHVHNVWYYRQKTFIFISLLGRGLGHCSSMKSNNRETVISPWKLLKHLIISSVIWEETCILSLCASILPLLSPILSSETTYHNSSLVKQKWEEDFPVPSKMYSHPQGCFDFIPPSPRIHSVHSGCVNIYIS